MLKTKEINVRSGKRNCITDLKKSDLVSTKDHAASINNCTSFITVIVFNFLREVLYRLWRMKLRNANALNPNEITCREDQILQEKMRSFDHQTVTKLLSSILNSLKRLKK